MEEILETQVCIKQELFIIRKAIQNLETNQRSKTSENFGQSSSTNLYSSPDSSTASKSSTPSPNYEEAPPAPVRPDTFPTIKVTSRNTPKPRNPRKKMNICFVGDSIAHTIDTLEVEKATRTIISKSKAYSSVHDHVSIYPDKNFSSVVPDTLTKKFNQTGMDYDILLLQASSIDITNLDSSNDTAENIKYLEHSARASSENLFNVAINAIKNTEVSNVIIMERIPRHDRIHDDPAGIKAGLSELANSHLHQLLRVSYFKEKIKIAKHVMDSSLGVSELYGSSKNFDGIHLRGPAGKYAYTRSVVSILRESGLPTAKHFPISFSSSKASFPAPSRFSTDSSRTSIDDHSNCEQAKYQRRRALAKQRKESPVFYNRGFTKDLYYSRNIFDILSNHKNSGN